jgi:hypothetical protein
MIKGLFRLVILLVLLFILTVLFAPQLLSTKFGKAALFKLYRALTGNIVSGETLHLSWWKGQSLSNLSWASRSKNFSLDIESATTSATLWQIAFYHDLGDLKLEAPKVCIATTFQQPVQAGFIPQLPSNFKLPYYGQITADRGEVVFVGPHLMPIDLKNIHLEATLLKSSVQLKSQGTTGYEQLAGSFDLSLLYLPTQGQIDLSTHLVNFPTRSLDQFFPALEGAIVQTVGDAMNIDLKLYNLPQSLQLFCDAASSTFSTHIETKTENDTVVLAAPGAAQVQIPPLLFKKITSLAIDKPYHANIKIDSFSMPLQDRENFAFQATVQGDGWQKLEPFSIFLATKNFKSRQFTAKLSSPQAQLSTSFYLPENWQELSASGEGLFPDNTRVTFEAKNLSTVSVQIQGDLAQGDFFGGFQNETLFLSQPAKLTYQLKTPQPLTLHLELSPCKVALPSLIGSVPGTLTADPFELQGISIKEPSVTFTADLAKKKASFTATAQIDEGHVAAAGIATFPFTLSSHVELTNIPSHLSSLFFSLPLADLIGPSVNATADVVWDDEQKLSLQTSSSNLSATASCTFKDDTLSLVKPATIHWTLTPEGYTLLSTWLTHRPPPITLSAPATFNITLASLYLPLNALLTTTGQATAFIPKLGFANTQLDQIKLSLEHKTSNSPLSFRLSTHKIPEGLASIFGDIDINTGEVKLESHVDQFPTEALDLVQHTLGNPPLSPFFGPWLNLTASATLHQWSGPLQFEVTSPLTRAFLKGKLTNGQLSLSDTFHLQISLHQMRAGNFSYHSEAPVTLSIPPGNVSCQLFPYNRAGINIPSGRLELGKIYCTNEGDVNVTLGLLKLSQSSPTLELWFAPTDFAVNQGLLEAERTEILAARTYQVCTWGEVSFVKAKVDMILGLTASCLKKAFGINDLPSNYVLQIPVRGPFHDVHVDSSKAKGKIAALLLWQQKDLAGNIVGGKAGNLLGKFVNKALPLPDSDSKAPPPKHPFPWEAPSEQAPATTKKKKISAEDSALKQAIKILR